MIKAVLFDFDGVLTNVHQVSHDSYKYFLKNYFPEKDELELEGVIQDAMILDIYGLMQIKYRSYGFVDRYNLDQDYVDKLYAFQYDYIQNYMQPREGAIELIKDLKTKGYKLAIITNGTKHVQMNKINKLGLADYFDAIVVSEEVGVKKPGRKMFDTAAEKLQVKNKECLVIGDTFSKDIVGGIKAGMEVAWIWLDEDNVCDYPVRRIRKLEEIYPLLDELK